MTSMLDTALAYHRAGLIVLPNDPIAKYPAGLRGWQTVRPSEQNIRHWFGNGKEHAIGVRDIEGLDFDNKGAPDAETLYQAWQGLVERQAPGLVQGLLCERTPRGGYHLVWRCAVIEGNQKLATRPPTKDEQAAQAKLTAVTLIETRGKGGQFQVAPSPGYTLVRGDWTQLPTITPDERAILLNSARALSRTDKRTLDLTQTTGERAGDAFNRDGVEEAFALLESDGWQTLYEKDGAKYLARPGKDRGVGATFGYVAPGVLYVFTSNAAPFQDNKAYGPFSIYAELEHGGDYKKAAAALYERKATAKTGTKTRVDLRTGEIITEDAPPQSPLATDWRTKGATLAELQYREFPPERWVIEGVLPEGACLFAAKYKSKKSWLSLALGLAISMGGKALGRLAVEQGDVLYLDLEGRQQRIQKRTRAMLGVRQVAWPANFHIYTTWTQADEGLQDLEHWLMAHPKAALIIIDVLASFRRPMSKQEEFYRYDRDTVDPINALAEKYHVAILLVHHFNKGKHDDIMDSITGSSGLPSAVNTMWALRRDVNDSTIQVLELRGRDLENDEPLALKWDSYLNQHIIEGPANEVAISTERKTILATLADDEPHTPKDIATTLGRPVETVKQLLRKLLNEGVIDKVGYGKYARIAKGDHSDHGGNSDHSDHSDHSTKSDRELPRVIGDIGTDHSSDHSSLTQQDALNRGSKNKSDRSDGYIKGTPEKEEINRSEPYRTDKKSREPFTHREGVRSTPVKNHTEPSTPIDRIPKSLHMTMRMMLVSDVERNIEVAQARCAEYGIDYNSARAWAIQWAKDH